MKKDTLLTHAGRDPLRYDGMVNTPVFRTSTVIHRNLAAYEQRPPEGEKIVRYGRYGTPTTFALEETVARLEGGYRAAAVPSGLAAMTGALYCEAPGSLTFEMQDIPAIATVAHERGAVVLADNTWGTPYFFRSFEHGVDVSLHAATKYISGHSDVMLGIVVANEKCWLPVRRTINDFGYSTSPDDCYLALRGFRTIGVRLKQQMQNGIRVANWLKQRPEVKRV